MWQRHDPGDVSWLPQLQPDPPLTWRCAFFLIIFTPSKFKILFFISSKILKIICFKVSVEVDWYARKDSWDL
ncbi:hypothetical protein D7033_13260 [Aquimarina sp. AD10]|nr:hypothetical protein D7033_13260 [Aquimarina sp. AD10]